MLSGCFVNGRKEVNYKIEKGDLRITSTKEYLIIEKCMGYNSLGKPIWNFTETIGKKDRFGCYEFMENICRE